MAATAANALNISTAGIVVFDGTATFSADTTTNHNVLVGAASNGITNVAPSATSGVPLISQGASSDPAFGTAVVAGGGTGATSFTAYAPIAGGTTTTGALQSAASGIGTSGFVFTSTGASSLPSFQAIPFTAMTWTDESTSFNAVAGNGYFVTGTATATMPASPSQGNTIAFATDATNVLTITANTGQIIRLGNVASASAGTCASNKRGDSITLVYRAADTTWIAIDSIGTWTVT